MFFRIKRKIRKVEKFVTLEQNGLIWVLMGRDIIPDKHPFPMPFNKHKRMEELLYDY